VVMVSNQLRALSSASSCSDCMRRGSIIRWQYNRRMNVCHQLLGGREIASVLVAGRSLQHVRVFAHSSDDEFSQYVSKPAAMSHYLSDAALIIVHKM